MINRLQFVHNSDLFKTREEAVAFLNNQYYKQVTRPSLYAEPVVLRYGDEKSPNIILAIGSKGTGSTTPTQDSEYFMIDVQGIKDDIEGKLEKIGNAVSKLAFTVSDTDTLDLEKIEDNNSLVVKGNVKVPQKVTINGDPFKNIIKTNKEGLYSYVNLKFDEKTNTFTFQVNDNVTEFSIPVIKSGKYDIGKEAIVFTFNDGTTTEVDLDDLIDEWTTEGEKSSTPIILKKEKHTDKNTDINDRNSDAWKDILKADVRIASDKKHNILQKTADGRNLYVKGTAENIYFKDGKNVKEALEGIKTEVSSAFTDNIIFKDYAKNGDYNGIAASVELEYSKETNILVFKHSNANGEVVRNEFKLNSASFIDDISYDTVKQSITIRYKDNDGKVHKTDIDLSNLLDDWVTNSEGHTVQLKKQVNKGNKDVLTADVKLIDKAVDNHQILEERDHKLYVKGTADNIFYRNNLSVRDAIDNSGQDIANIYKKQKELSGSSYFEVGSTATVDMSKALHETAHTVTANVKLSSKKNNSILINNFEGLYSSIDYDPERNVIIVSDLSSNTNQREIQLNSISTIEFMKYDAAREVIVIGYKANGSSAEVKKLEISVTDLLAEWKVNNSGHNVRMVRSPHTVDGIDMVSSDVVLATEGNYADNLIKEASMSIYGEEMKGLYVSGNELAEKVKEISKEESKLSADKAVESAKTYTDSVHTTITSEIATAKNEAVEGAKVYTDEQIKKLDNALKNEIATASTQASNNALQASREYTDGEIQKLDTKSSKYASDAEKNAKDYADNLRQTSKDEISNLNAEVKSLISNEVSDRKAEDALINNKLDHEVSERKTAVENIQKSVDVEKEARVNSDTNLQTAITNESKTRENAISQLDGKISKEIDDRAKADTAIKDKLSDKIDEAKSYTDEKSTKALNDAKSYTDTKSEALSGAIKSYIDKEVGDITLVGATTKTAKVTVTGKEISTDVRIASGDKNRILNNSDGLYVGDISANYNAQTNTLTINGIDGKPVLTQKLNSASFIDSITYDDKKHTLEIVYHTTDGQIIRIPIDLAGLVLDIKADETSNTPIQVTIPDAVMENGVSVKKIKADVNIADNVEGNILKTVMSGGKGALMADASGIFKDIKEISASTKNLSGLTEAIQEEIDKVESAAGLDKQGNYVKSEKPYISGATSLMDADKKLADAVSNVEKAVDKLTQGGQTHSVNLFTEKDPVTQIPSFKADVRLSLAKDQDENDLIRKKIPHANEYEGNLLQIVKAEDNGSPLEVENKVNGLYFSGSIDYGMMKGDDTLG